MAEQSIPVDLFNPGQVFACLGIVELSERILGPTTGHFDWNDSSHVVFRAATSHGEPVTEALRFLAEAEVEVISPRSDLRTDQAPCRAPVNREFSTPIPESAASLPAQLTVGEVAIVVSSWGETNLFEQVATGRDNVKFWAGAGGYPGVGLLKDALALARPHLADAVRDPFAVSGPQSSSFRFDWRRDYIPLQIGFSVNNHAMTPIGYPVVEVLAAVGLEHARPLRPERRNKLLYTYCVCKSPLPAPLLRAALGGAVLPFPTRRFQMALDWPGKEGQARCIATVTEENV